MAKRRTHPKARRNEAQLGKRVCVPSGRKVRFPRERQAKQAANQLRAHKAGIPELRVYRCPHCCDWHFTSQTEEQARIIEKGRSIRAEA
jgi:hypothetical protein